MDKHKVGDRVCRHEDVFNTNSKLMTGTVIKVYGRRSYFGWYDPELYSVLWDDGKIGEAYFRHGINKIEEK